MKDFKPPLPEPFIQYEGCAPMFTEAQLLAYRAEVIEMCAKEMEGEFTYNGEDVAKAIRSLK